MGAAGVPAGALLASNGLAANLRGYGRGGEPAIVDRHTETAELAPAGPSLAVAAQASRRYFGAAVRMDQLTVDPSLRDLVVRDCRFLTPEIDLYWNCLERTKGQYNFKPVDDLLDFAAAHDMEVRGHALIWEPCTPDWAKAEMRARRDWDLVAGHFARVLGRYSDRIGEWNVVNEPIDTVDGDRGMRRTSFQCAFGSDYVARALREARVLAPNARLLINEYGFEYDNPTDAARRGAFLRLIRDLKAGDIPLDGVGLQAHLDLAKGPVAESALHSFFREITAAGLDITVSELDVRERDFDLPDAERDHLVADQTRRYLDLALAEASVRGVVTWGLSDKHSWLTENPTQAQLSASGHRLVNRDLPYDQACRRTQMYEAIRGAFDDSARIGTAFGGGGNPVVGAMNPAKV